jgi:DNA invertase Pin-like site-specific DNA recombinase
LSPQAELPTSCPTVEQGGGTHRSHRNRGCFLLATLSSLAKLERGKISQRTKAGLERVRANGKILGRPRFSDGDRNKLIAALKTGDSWQVVTRKTRIPYSTVKKHARALGYEPKRARAIKISDD